MDIPPLAFLDDLLSIVDCRVSSIVCNSFINLEFGIDKEKNIAKKCRHIHVGKPNMSLNALLRVP